MRFNSFYGQLQASSIHIWNMIGASPNLTLAPSWSLNMKILQEKPTASSPQAEEWPSSRTWSRPRKHQKWWRRRIWRRRRRRPISIPVSTLNTQHQYQSYMQKIMIIHGFPFGQQDVMKPMVFAQPWVRATPVPAHGYPVNPMSGRTSRSVTFHTGQDNL